MVLNEHELAFVKRAIESASKQSQNGREVGGIISLELYVDCDGRVNGRTEATFRQVLPSKPETMNFVFTTRTGIPIVSNEYEMYERLRAKYEQVIKE